MTAIDVSLLIEQLGRSPLLDQIRRQGRDDLVPDAETARRRIVALAVDGLRAGSPQQPLPGPPPSLALFTERWRPADASPPPSPASSSDPDEGGSPRVDG